MVGRKLLRIIVSPITSSYSSRSESDNRSLAERRRDSRFPSREIFLSSRDEFWLSDHDCSPIIDTPDIPRLAKLNSRYRSKIANDQMHSDRFIMSTLSRSRVQIPVQFASFGGINKFCSSASNCWSVKESLSLYLAHECLSRMSLNRVINWQLPRYLITYWLHLFKPRSACKDLLKN